MTQEEAVELAYEYWREGESEWYLAVDRAEHREVAPPLEPHWFIPIERRSEYSYHGASRALVVLEMSKTVRPIWYYGR
jgi:hypothetical protein